MLKFISFGSGSSGNSYLLYTDKDGILIDAGIGVRSLKKALRDYGIPITRIGNILITHDHADHVKSVGSLSREFDIPVYSTKEVHEGIFKNYCVVKKIEGRNAHCLRKSETKQIGEFSVTPFNVPHDSTDCVGYFIQSEAVSFCIVTDVGEITDEIKTYISRANYLVIEANHDEEMLKDGPYPEHLKRRIMGIQGHLSNKKCGEALVENSTEKLKMVWLCHLSEENNHPELARKTVEAILRNSGIIVGKEFGLEVLKRKTPTGIFDLK